MNWLIKLSVVDLENGKAWKAEQDRIEAEQKALQEKAAREEADRVAGNKI